MIRKITHEGTLKLGGMEIPAYVLEDGTRVLAGRAMQRALKMVDEVEGKQTAGTRLVRYLNQKSLKPYIYREKSPDHFKPLNCETKGGAKVNGYEATVLADVCDGFLEARKHIVLSKRQEIIATECEILMRGFAKIGIIALVDEATGYQHQRERDELQTILQAYISKDLLEWQKRFPDTFYTEIFRLNGWDYTVTSIKKRPGVVGTWTNKLIYEQLPKGVLDELKKVTPKSEAGNYTARFFQSLTPDIGNPDLQRQIYSVIGVMNISDSWKDFTSNFNKMVARKAGQLELKFEDLEPKATTNKIEHPTHFDKQLRGLLSVPPPPK